MEPPAKCAKTAAEPPFPLLDISSEQTLQWCRTLPEPPSEFADDVFVCSYPKSGTTWMQHIVGTLVLWDKSGKMPEGHVSKRTPFYEIDPHWAAAGRLAPHIESEHAQLGRRMFNSHLHWSMMPDHGRARYIYVCRDGRDACCSFYHHLSSQRTKAGDKFVFEGSFADFHAKWVAGKIEYGRWADHLVSWDQASKDARVLILSYEEMCANLRPCLKRVVEHLQLRNIDDAALDKLLPCFSFDDMKKNRDNFQPTSVKWKDGFSFLRKGVKGDHGSLYGDQEHRDYAQMFAERFADGKPPVWAPYGTAAGT
eukprot:TRINITY_DN101792_c0_g1_i1.p1 TRINITY_DN101792_c0_g1~~TRINITY_DN101792_c0_g1_i1.p1  ORF type:complete len:310 (-),score=29.76 TRINITY_DN101792_c0_g1_i1:167-1096(-)